MIKLMPGDLFKTKAKTLVNAVNCVGVMGAGIAHEFKKKFPDMFLDYERLCRRGKVRLGIPYLYEDILDTSIVNFPTKQHWKHQSKVSDIINGLDVFIQNYKIWCIESVAFPALGCGLGGLDWGTVGPIMYQKLSQLDADIEIYLPAEINGARAVITFCDDRNDLLTFYNKC